MPPSTRKVSVLFVPSLESKNLQGGDLEGPPQEPLPQGCMLPKLQAPVRVKKNVNLQVGLVLEAL